MQVSIHPHPSRREAFAEIVARLDLSTCNAHPTLEALLQTGDVDAVWIRSHNHSRLDAMKVITAEVEAGRSAVKAEERSVP